MSVEIFSLATPMPVSAEELFAWHSRPGAFQRLVPPWETAEVVEQSGKFGNGMRVTVRTSLLGPITKDWVAELYDVEPGRQFRDRQLSGPFTQWNHTHRMHPTAEKASVLEDRIEYELPFGAIGSFAGSGLVRSRLEQIFAYRHALMASDLRCHARFRDRPRLTIAVTGSTGLVGSDLCLFLATGGHRVIRLRRGEPKPNPVEDGTSSRKWDPDTIDPKVLEGVDAVIHLAGESIGEGSWSAAKKARIRDSRVAPTRKLAESAAAAGVKTFVSTSAVGFYGDRGDEQLTEESSPGTGFLADVCREWEAAADPARSAGLRVANVRFGAVLSPKGGALGKQLPAFRSGGGAVLGSGDQWVSWISVHDVVGAIHHVLMDETLSGPCNVTAPEPVTNREFGRVLANVLSRPYLLTIPAVGLRTMFGEIADELLLASQRTKPARLAAAGFDFEHPDLESALRFLLGYQSFSANR